MLTLDTGPVNSRPYYHPQTNGKLERFDKSVEEEAWRHICLDDDIKYYNTDRLHRAPDMDNYKTPSMAFRNKTATYEIKMQDPKWMEADING